MKQKKITPYPFKTETNTTLLTQSNFLDVFVGKPFWIADKERHDIEYLITNGQCCFNHIIGLPIKNDKEYPIFDYELDVVEKIESHRNIFIKKHPELEQPNLS